MRHLSNYLRLLALATVLFVAACGGDKKLDATELLPVDEMYAEAKTSLENGNTERAVKYYKRLVARFPFGRYTEQAQLELAYAQYRSNDHEEALSSANRFIKTYPTHRHIDYAYYLRGLINFTREIGLIEKYIKQDTTRRDLGFTRQAFQDFGELVKRYPHSRYAPDARQRMIFLKNGMAQSELNIARFYFDRKAYVAAQNRAKYIIENYQQTPQAGDALAILSESYKRLGDERLAGDARRVLELNYPDHPYLDGNWPNERNKLWQLLPFVGEGKKS